MSELLGTTPLGTTPSQTVGPFLAIALPWSDGPDVVAEEAPGAITIVGRLTDGAGDPVPDGLIETWQADPAGRFAHPDDPRGPGEGFGVTGFRGFGRCPTDADGRFRFRTLKPGPLPCEDGGVEAPHIDVSVFARGVVRRLVTRLYFPDEAAANEADPVLATLTTAERDRLVAVAEDDGTLRFDIRLQGSEQDGYADETPFFEL
jgi:protocatechuate 3,4-dioxygenase alpha subunit